MQIQIEGRHLKVTESLKKHVHKKIDHLDKYFSGTNNIHVIMSLEPTDKKHAAEIICNVSKGQPLVAHSSHADMYTAVDDAVHKIREHLKKHNARLRTRRRDSGRTPVEQEVEVNEDDE